jgi:hypothetical protein
LKTNSDPGLGEGPAVAAHFDLFEEHAGLAFQCGDAGQNVQPVVRPRTAPGHQPSATTAGLPGPVWAKLRFQVRQGHRHDLAGEPVAFGAHSCAGGVIIRPQRLLLGSERGKFSVG